MSNTTLTTSYLTVNNNDTSRIPKKSVSTSTLGHSLLPRPVVTSSSSYRQRTTIVPKKTTTTEKQKRPQRATVTPQVHRRRTSSTSSSSSQSTNWLTGIFSSPQQQLPKKRIQSVVRLTVDKDNRDWQINENSIRYLGTRTTKKFDLGEIFDAAFTRGAHEFRLFTGCSLFPLQIF